MSSSDPTDRLASTDNGKFVLEKTISYFRNKFADLHHLEADKKKKVLENFGTWWEKYIFRGQKGDISQSDFLKQISADFQANKQKFHNDMKECISFIFEVIDTNRDRSISQEEFNIAFRAYGQDKIADDEKFFQAFNPKDGLVPLGVITDAWIDYVTNEDASKPNPVYSVVNKK